MKESLESLLLLEEFVATTREASLSDKAELSARKEHERASLSIYSACKGLLDRYGKKHSKQISVAAGEGIYGMHFETVGYLKTPEVSMNVKGKKIALTIEEDFTTGSDYSKTMDTVLISGNGNNLFEISQTQKETTNWLDKKASPEQMRMAILLLSDIDGLLQEKYGARIERKEEMTIAQHAISKILDGGKSPVKIKSKHYGLPPGASTRRM
ncbi:MAG: hypothetical protein US59_C0013G0021 [Candidatus Levybacteria bacterium GW2011_GWB1_37_8]|nr:MAG: hypothetical protein US59_C0013G0021 [Candidatus Levybacteria bacterium GW2011_GWB1_37_8]